MRTALFDFELPPDRIALRPISPRDAARLLVVRPGETPELADRGVRDLPDLLRPGDALVVNDTRVIPARLVGRRIGRGEEPRIEATPVRWMPRIQRSWPCPGLNSSDEQGVYEVQPHWAPPWSARKLERSTSPPRRKSQ